jgi:hypothetical protein
MTRRETMPSTLALTALASLLFALLPAAAFAAPADGTSVPVARGEAPARSCYLRAQQQWNQTMAASPRNHRQLDSSYRAFAQCAKIAIDTGKVLRNGERVPWLPEYFANTVGATYAQLQLATITFNPEHCTHLSQAKDLAAQASETEGEMDTPGDANFEQTWDTLQKNLKSQAATCGRSANASSRAAARASRTHGSGGARWFSRGFFASVKVKSP